MYVAEGSAAAGLTVRVVCRIQCLDRSPQYRQRSNHTVQVEVAVSLVSVSSLSLARMEVSLELHLTQTWADPRCRFRSLAGWEDTVTLQGAGLQHRCPHCSITAVYDGVPVARLEHLWLPDTVITPAVQVTARPQQTTRLHHTGTISHRTRLSVVAACPMNLHLFPFDRWHHQSLVPSPAPCPLQPAVRAGAAELLLPPAPGGLQLAGGGSPVPG